MLAGREPVIHGFHSLWVERAGVLDLLLTDLAPSRILGGIVLVGGPAMHHVARAHRTQQILWIVGMRWVFHRIEVIEVTEELVEAVNARQVLVPVPEMILAKLAGGVAHRLQDRGRGHRFGGKPDLGAGLADGGQAGTNRQLSSETVGLACLKIASA